MRRTSLILAATALLWSAASLSAQQQDKGFKERVLGEPDRTMEFQGWKNGFNSGKSAFNSSTARVQKFQFEQKVRAENYVTRDFLGTKGAWEGEFLYETADADTEGRYIIPKKDTQYDAEVVTSEDAKDSKKKARSKEYSTKEVQLRGKAQGAIDEKYHKDKKPMSIDDVRDLLNKSN